MTLKQQARRAELFRPILDSKSGEKKCHSVPSESVVRAQKSIAKSAFLPYPYAGENAELLYSFPLRVPSAEQIVFHVELIC